MSICRLETAIDQILMLILVLYSKLTHGTNSYINTMESLINYEFIIEVYVLAKSFSSLSGLPTITM